MTAPTDLTTIDRSELVVSRSLPADQHPAIVYLASLAPGSVPAQRSALKKIAELFNADTATLNWAGLRYQHVQFIRAQLAAIYSATTANRLLTALRRVLKEAYQLRQIPHDDYILLSSVKRITVENDDTEAGLMGRALAPLELTNLFGTCAEDKTIAGARDAAVIGLGYGLGMRRAEVAKLTMSNYSREKNTISVKGGKGNKSRTIPIGDGAQKALEDWLKIRGDVAGPIFYGINKGGNITSKRLNVRAVDELFTKRANQAGLLDAHFHDLRRTFISDLLDESVDVVTAAKLAGHSDPQTTMRYDRRKMETRRRAVALLHVPYQRSKRSA
jgi:integrase